MSQSRHSEKAAREDMLRVVCMLGADLSLWDCDFKSSARGFELPPLDGS